MSTIKSSDDHLVLNAEGTAKDTKIQTNGTDVVVVNSTGVDVTGTASIGSGIIGDIGGDISVVQGSVGVRVNDAASALSPTTATLNNDASVDLGVSNIRFKDLYLSGGAYLGGTAAGNKLDDYEEGTWTPTITEGTISSSYAQYVKVGRTVHVKALIYNFSDQTSGAGISIGGLPFASDGESTSAVFARYINQGDGAVCIHTSGTVINVFTLLVGGNYQTTTHSHLNSASARVYVELTYNTNA